MRPDVGCGRYTPRPTNVPGRLATLVGPMTVRHEAWCEDGRHRTFRVTGATPPGSVLPRLGEWAEMDEKTACGAGASGYVEKRGARVVRLTSLPIACTGGART